VNVSFRFHVVGRASEGRRARWVSQLLVFGRKRARSARSTCKNANAAFPFGKEPRPTRWMERRGLVISFPCCRTACPAIARRATADASEEHNWSRIAINLARNDPSRPVPNRPV
jgi:hypothetical protein